MDDWLYEPIQLVSELYYILHDKVFHSGSAIPLETENAKEKIIL